MNRKMVCRLLNSLGHTCEEADDGPVAVRFVRRSLEMSVSAQASENGPIPPFDGVLMDNVMVKIHGPQAAREMRSIGYRCPIIGVTGNALPSDIDEFKLCGANEVIQKPLKREMVVMLLDKYSIETVAH